MKRKHIILTLLMLIPAVVKLQAGEPEKYRIEFMNCKRILVGNKWLKNNDTFEDPMTIHWKNGKQYLRVRSLKTQKEYGLNMDAFIEAKVQNLRDFLIKTNSVSTRGRSRFQHYSQVVHYLVDSLQFQAFEEPQPDVVTEAIWQQRNGSKHVTPIQRTPDNKFYIITRDVLGAETPPDSLLLDIQERSIKENWRNRVYRQIPIRCLPIEVE